MSGLPGALPSTSSAASPTPSTPTPAAALSPREQALLAAEQRAKQINTPQYSSPDQAHQRSESPFNPTRNDILVFSRIMDSQLLPNCSKTQAVETLSTLEKLLSNILSPPNPTAASKYRQIRLSNPLIQRTIMNVSNSAPHDYLVACGFRRQTIDFTAYLVFPPSPISKELHKLKTGVYVLESTLKRAKEAEEREKRYRESEKDAEKMRKEKALLEFEEDRRLRSEKDEREKFVREAQAAKPSPPVVPRATSPAPRPRAPAPPRTVLRQSRSRGIVMGEVQDRVGRDGAEDGTPPPAYGESHGRVLGTGLPPPAVELPGRQAMEDSEEEDEGGMGMGMDEDEEEDDEEDELEE